MKKTLLTLLCVTTSVVTSQAAIQILPDPSSATASSFFAGAGGFPVTELYDGTITDLDIGTTNNQGGAYAGQGAGPHTVVYDMGSVMDIGGFVFANRAGNGSNNVDQVLQIEFWFGNTTTDQAATATFIANNATADRMINVSASNYRNLAAYDFGSNTSTQFVTMRLTGDNTVATSNNPGGNELILATHVVPEPSSFMLLGLSGLALFKRRRK